MDRNSIWKAIETELRKAKKLYPSWPDHPAAQAGIVCEEAGELMQACLQWKYERKELEADQEAQIKHMEEEAVQVAAMAFRFLENIRSKQQPKSNE